MIKKIFTDETGAKWEQGMPFDSSYMVIKPIKQVEKRKHKLQFWELGKVTNIPIAEEFDLTEPTAIAISEAIKSLIEFIQNKNRQDSDYFEEKAIEAYKAYQAERS